MNHKLIAEELKIIDNDTMLNTLKISKEDKYNGALQENIVVTTIEKNIYKKANEVFNRNGRSKAILKCEFVLHTKGNSSFVKVIGLKDEIVYSGNYLHSNASDKSKKEHLLTISRMHDLEIIKRNF